MTAPQGLEALSATVWRDLELLDHHSPSWVRSREGVFDVVIVGGGQSGLGAAFGLMREKVGNILVVDENPAGLEGPWVTYARMITLRTPKQLTSIDFGMPSLTFRAWFEAQHGAAAWAALDKIPRADWMAYLRWYREVLQIPLRNETRVTLIEPLEDGLFRLSLEGGGELLARKVVLATGTRRTSSRRTCRKTAGPTPRSRSTTGRSPASGSPFSAAARRPSTTPSTLWPPVSPRRMCSSAGLSCRRSTRSATWSRPGSFATTPASMTPPSTR